MIKIKAIRPEYVTHLPDVLEEGVLYVSEEFSIAGHKCCCGCGEEVITPLNPAQWRINRRGKFVSMFPSIGNWKYACKSHYWIKDNQVIESVAMSKNEIAYIQNRDRIAKDLYIQKMNSVNKMKSGSFDYLKRWVRTIYSKIKGYF